METGAAGPAGAQVVEDKNPEAGNVTTLLPKMVAIVVQGQVMKLLNSCVEKLFGKREKMQVTEFCS